MNVTVKEQSQGLGPEWVEESCFISEIGNSRGEAGLRWVKSSLEEMLGLKSPDRIKWKCQVSSFIYLRVKFRVEIVLEIYIWESLSKWYY